MQVTFRVEEPQKAFERPGTNVYVCGRQAFSGVVVLQRRVSCIQGLFCQHVLDILANVVDDEFVQLERRVAFSQPALQVSVGC